ncbi:MAG: hypothetical protein LRY73_12295 [Bacillus sp. (in: Bacteria)]|nr:hypothetical protein [Bacillus sp. (in: firmicutes)]
MNRRVGVFLFTLFGFLLWLYMATDLSTIDKWWSVVSTKEITTTNTDRTVITPPTSFEYSLVKLFSGMVVFLLLGSLLSFLVREKVQRN